MRKSELKRFQKYSSDNLLAGDADLGVGLKVGSVNGAATVVGDLLVALIFAGDAVEISIFILVLSGVLGGDTDSLGSNRRPPDTEYTSER